MNYNEYSECIGIVCAKATSNITFERLCNILPSVSNKAVIFVAKEISLARRLYFSKSNFEYILAGRISGVFVNKKTQYAYMGKGSFILPTNFSSLDYIHQIEQLAYYTKGPVTPTDFSKFISLPVGVSADRAIFESFWSFAISSNPDDLIAAGKISAVYIDNKYKHIWDFADFFDRKYINQYLPNQASSLLTFQMQYIKDLFLLVSNKKINSLWGSNISHLSSIP